MAGGVEYQVTKVDPTNPETKGMVYQVHKVTEEVAATLGGKVYRARIINNPTEPTVVGKVYQIVLIDDPDDPAVKGKVYNAILTGGSEVVVIGPAVSPLALPDAIADSLHYVKAFGGTELLPKTYLDTVTLSGGCEQRNLPAEYTQVNYVTNTAQTMINTGVRFDFSKNYEIELKASGVTGSWYILQARETSGSPISGISGSSTGNVIGVNFDGTYVAASQISRVFGHIYYVKGTINNGNMTLYVKDETAGTEETVTGTYTPRTGQSVDICLFGNIAGNYVAINSDIYFARVKENDTFVMDYVPARQSATAGFYDKVSGTFKTASNLVADGNAVPTPDTPMDIVSNNGVLKVSPNLFNKATVSFNALINNTTGETYTPSPENHWNWVSDYIKVQPNTTYYFMSGANYNVRFFEYGASKNYLNNHYTILNSSFTTGATCEYLRFHIGGSQGGQSMYEGETQLELGSTATTYRPYGIYTDGTVEQVTDSDGLTATAEMLLAVGDYKDIQEVLSGGVTKNIGIKVMTGDETFQVGTNGWISEDTITDNLNAIYTPICTHFAGTDTTPTANSNTVRVYYTSQNIPRVYFGVDKTIYTSAEVFKQYLADQYAAGTPVIIIYPLATATTETVTPQVLEKEPVTQTAGSISNLDVTAVSSSHTTPTPQKPLQINCNNGVLKVRNQSGLPWGYTLLEYIESSGTQYIDTGVSGNATIKITAQASTTKGSSQALLSSTSGASGGTWFGEFTTNQKWGIGSGAGLTTIDPTTKMTAEIAFDGSGCSGTVNGESITRSATITQGGWTIMATSQLNYPFSGKVWGCQITQSGTLVRNFVPCKNASNVVGMYDLVNGVFYQNAGTGTFTAGNPVSDPVEVYADGLQETINMHSKNLFDEQWTRNTGVSTQAATWGQVVTASGWSTSGLVPVKAGQQYTVSYNTTNQIYVFYYESDGTMQSSYDTATATKKTFTVPAGATHIRLQVNKSTEAQIADLESQLETGATATDYEPYYNGGTATAEMLLKAGTYQDVQSIIDGVVTRSIGVKVLDGTESWTVASTNVLQADVFPVSSAQPAVGGYCTALSYTDSSTLSGMPENSFRLGSQVYPRRLYAKSSAYATDATTWTNYLKAQYAAGTPVIVVYPLATATTESVTGQTLQVQEGDNIVEITQASLNNLELEAEYEKEGA